MFSSFADYATIVPLEDLRLQHCVAVGLGPSAKRALARGWGLPRSSISISRTGLGTSSGQSGSGSVLVEVDFLVSRVGLVPSACAVSAPIHLVQVKSRTHGLDLFGSVYWIRAFVRDPGAGRGCFARLVAKVGD